MIFLGVVRNFFFSWNRFSRLAFVRYKSPFFADFLHVMDSSSSGKVDDLGPDTLYYLGLLFWELWYTDKNK